MRCTEIILGRRVEGGRLPVYFRGEKLRNEALIIGAQFLDVAGLVALRIEVVGVERAHCLQCDHVFGIGQMHVSILAVPSRKG